MTLLKALLIGSDPGLMGPIPPLLSRAGFVIDVISQSPLLQKTPKIRGLTYVYSDEEVLETLRIQTARDQSDWQYDLVIISDDVTLSLILQSNLPKKIKVSLLPVTSELHFGHLYSKIGLSQALLAGHILTPKYAVAQNTAELIPLANTLGYPVVIKIDASSGGSGVFICQSNQDISDLLINQHERINCSLPLLIQEKIEGSTLDLSAFYQDGQLIYFSHAVEERTTYPLGPSCLRTYTQLGALDQAIFTELAAIGKALGADGFSNITSVWSNIDRKRYIIEADMRPNVWADYSRYLGNDLAIPIKTYFENRQILHYPQTINEQFSSTLLIPLVSRLKFWEILVNRYGVWQFSTGEQIIRRLIGHPIAKLRNVAIQHLKPVIPARIWLILEKYFALTKIKIIYLLSRY